MSKLDEYGRGKLASLNELDRYFSKQLNELKSYDVLKYIHNMRSVSDSANRSGQIAALSKVIERIKMKKKRLEND